MQSGPLIRSQCLQSEIFTMPLHKLIRATEAEVQTKAEAKGLEFNHTEYQSEVFRANGSRVCWMSVSHDVLQVQLDNVKNASKDIFLEPVYGDFTDPIKAAEYILSLVSLSADTNAAHEAVDNRARPGTIP
jgi:hypothetical protein